MNLRCLFALAVLPLCLSACAFSNRAAAEKVVITTIPKLVERCNKIGPVTRALDNSLGSDDLFELQTQALAVKANTILIRSITSTDSGSAYHCDPPLSQEANLGQIRVN